MPRLVRRKEERGNVILSILNVKTEYTTYTEYDHSPFTPPRSMSQGMVKLTASDAVSRTFSPWMLMEIKLSRKKSYKKAQHCYRTIHLNTESLKVDFLWAVTFNIKKKMLHSSFHEMSSNILSVMYHVSCHYRCHAQTGLRTRSKHCEGRAWLG